MKPIVCKHIVLPECKSTIYEIASQQVMSCESIPLWVASQQGCELWANKPASYQVNSMWGCKLT